MPEYIDKANLIKALGVAEICADCQFSKGLFCDREKQFTDACEVIFGLPTTDVVERKKGNGLKRGNLLYTRTASRVIRAHVVATLSARKTRCFCFVRHAVRRCERRQRMTTIRLLDARRGLYRKCEELFKDAKVAEAIYRYLCDGIEECEDAEPERKKGRWRRRLVDSGFNADWHCSECGWKTSIEDHGYNYCPHCGAEMKGEDDADE